MNKLRILLILLVFNSPILVFAQLNDDCIDAIELCENQIIDGTTVGATLEQCTSTNPNGCADDNTPCFLPAATVWYKFTTNSTGGAVAVNFTNVIIDPTVGLGTSLHAVIVRSDSPCEGLNYIEASSCQNNGTTAFTITSLNALLPNTTYYIQVNGSGVGPGVAQPAQVTFDIQLTGVGVNILPISAQISASKTVICQGDIGTVDFSLTNCIGKPKFEWNYNGALIFDEVNFSTAILTESGYLYLKLTCGPENCPQMDVSDSIFFDVTPIAVNAGSDQLIEMGESIVLQGSGIGNPLWTPGSELSATDIYTPLATPSEATTFFLTVTNGGCTLTDEVQIGFKSGLEIPSAFTPNGDNNNDFWEIGFINQYLNNQVTIYDRSGQIIFKTIGYNNGTNFWDGTFKNKPVPPSTYFYVIDLRSGEENQIQRGPVTIIR